MASMTTTKFLFSSHPRNSAFKGHEKPENISLSSRTTQKKTNYFCQERLREISCKIREKRFPREAVKQCSEANEAKK